MSEFITNAELRIEAERLCDDNEHLREENAKLRELVKAFWWCTENFDMQDKCDSCPLLQTTNTEVECEVIMRELGIEED